MIILPTEPITATLGGPKSLIIYGAPKVGKTEMTSSIPDSLLVDIEDGSDRVTAMKVKLDNILQWPALETEIRKSNGRFKIGILDTLDMLENWAEVEATRRYKASAVGKNFGGSTVLELAMGGGYLHLRNVFYEYFQRFKSMFPYTVFIGHLRDKLLASESKGEVTAKDLDLTGKIRNITCSYADAIALCYRDKEGKLKLSFVTTDTTNCGSRCEHLRGKEFAFGTPAKAEDWKQIYP